MAEVEVISLGHAFLEKLNILDKINLKINTLGDSETRLKYRKALVDYLNDYKSELSNESIKRLSENPLRILDSKNETDKKILINAPNIIDYLNEVSQERFEKVCSGLSALKIKYQIDKNLVRGLDYYNDTVFEWVSDELGAQGTVCGGGRYDGLVEQLGGKPTPAVGFAMGIERLYLLLEAHDFAALPGSDAPGAYVIVADPAYQAFAFEVTESLRSALPEFAIMQHLAAGSIKSQFKKADKSGAKFALVIAENEVAEQTVTIKNLHTGEQSIVSVSKDTTELAAALK